MVCVFAGKGVAAEHGKIKYLPAPVAQTIKEKFPDAIVVGFVMEREPGVRYYEVNLRRGEDRIEVEVAPDGNIGEIESRVVLERTVRSSPSENQGGSRKRQDTPGRKACQGGPWSQWYFRAAEVARGLL